MPANNEVEFSQSFQSAVHHALSRVPSGEQALFCQFCDLFAQNLPPEDWRHRTAEDGAAVLCALWNQLTLSNPAQRFIGSLDAQLASFNCRLNGSTLLVIQPDRPFLVDSLRLTLTRLHLPIKLLKNAVFALQRDAANHVTTLQGAAVKQSLIYIETKRLSEAEYQSLRADLTEVFDDIAVMVADYHTITEALDSLDKRLTYAPVEPAQVQDTQAFLHWLKAGHFTFLGLRIFHFKNTEQGACLEEDDAARLGVFRRIEPSTDVQWSEGIAHFYSRQDLIAFSKSSTRCRVHRLVYPDYIVVKMFNARGEVDGEMRILGLFTYPVYSLNPVEIPLLSYKIHNIIQRANVDANSYSGKHLQRVIETYPRDELFQAGSEELIQTILGVARINERKVVRLFFRFDEFGRFATVVAYIPRDLYHTQLRLKMEQLLGAALASRELDSTTAFSESVLARAFMVFRLGLDSPKSVDTKALEEAIRQLARPWQEELAEVLEAEHADASALIEQFVGAFSKSYQASFTPRQALAHIAVLQDQADQTLRLELNCDGDNPQLWIITLFHLGQSLALSDVVPILEHLGLKVLGEHSYKVTPIINEQSCEFYLHHFSVQPLYWHGADCTAVSDLFVDAFKAVWHKRCESDSFNRLVLAANMPYYAANMFRAYAVYLKQTLFFLGVEAISDALLKHAKAAAALWRLFEARFNPAGVSQQLFDAEQQWIAAYLEGVTHLNEDKILRRLLELINNTLRTNLYQFVDAAPKSYIALKLATAKIADIPEPKPAFEIFMYGPAVEGVHLRTSKVARGGLRWSDRLQDYRTEVLGLVKAQQVKNSVIVPSGAKGGFVPKNIPPEASRDQIQSLGVAAYRTFISALLDITDNYRAEGITRPPQVICYDDPDPYLVVAADKGTATFSDIANGISQDYGHWLKDAFASGGSQGYDHKGMGITARGAWVAVERHFRELGRSTFSDDFTVVGIGDMSGDVFGNGMLLTEHICLVAAFNHLHIFIDPTPNAAASFIERKRLFALPRSSWSEYDASLISSGGGVFLRSAKAISITEPMKQCFGITADQLTPNELIHALLQAPVDLIWNGGIGTYVKSSLQTHAEIGDKANDNLRVDGQQLRCKIFGEGGNLGMSQLGRIEYCLQGGACNTDFIDNAGGVDCSDHEVNIKICLDELISSGQLSLVARNELMRTMTSEVAQLVLGNIQRQTLALSFAANEVKSRMGEYVRFMEDLERQGRLQRKLEFLPNAKALSERSHLTRPELAVLLSYAKVMLKDVLVEPGIYQDAYLAHIARGAFPASLQVHYADALSHHRLHPQIVATQLANEMVNNLGITTPLRLKQASGASWVEFARAYTAAREVLQFEVFQHQLMDDPRFSAAQQMQWFSIMSRRLRRVTRWYLHLRTELVALEHLIPLHRQALQSVNIFLRNMHAEDSQALLAFQSGSAQWQAQGVPARLAELLAMPEDLFSHIGVVQQGIGVGDKTMAQTESCDHLALQYYRLKTQLKLASFIHALAAIPISNNWQSQVRDTYLLDIERKLSQMAALSLPFAADLPTWFSPCGDLLERWHRVIEDIEKQGLQDFAVFAVAMNMLGDITKRLTS